MTLTLGNGSNTSYKIQQLIFCRWFTEILCRSIGSPSDWRNWKIRLEEIDFAYKNDWFTFSEKSFFVQNAHGIQTKHRCLNQCPECEHFSDSFAVLLFRRSNIALAPCWMFVNSFNDRLNVTAQRHRQLCQPKGLTNEPVQRRRSNSSENWKI